LPAKSARARSVANARSGDAARRAERIAQRPGGTLNAELPHQAERCAWIERERLEQHPLHRRPALCDRTDEVAVRVGVRPEAGGSLVDATQQQHGLLVVKRMRDACGRLEPFDVKLELAEHRRRSCERLNRGADVVPEAGQGELLCPHAAADRLGRLVYDNVEAGAGKGDRRGKAVRPRPDNDGLTRQGLSRTRATQSRTASTSAASL